MMSGALLAGSAVAFLAALGSYDGYQTLQMSPGWIPLSLDVMGAPAMTTDCDGCATHAQSPSGAYHQQS